MARRKRKRCTECNKLIYGNAASAFHAALASSRVFGGGFRIFPCPLNTSLFHVTGKEVNNGARSGRS